jgi:hypothetical protein
VFFDECWWLTRRSRVRAAGADPGWPRTSPGFLGSHDRPTSATRSAGCSATGSCSAPQPGAGQPRPGVLGLDATEPGLVDLVTKGCRRCTATRRSGAARRRVPPYRHLAVRWNR